MANLEAEVCIKLIEVSKIWTEAVVQNFRENAKRDLY